MFDRFRDDAKLAMNLARELACKAGDGSLDAVHVLYGSLRAEGALAAKVLERCGVSGDVVAAWAEREAGQADPGNPDATQVAFHPRAKRVIEVALEQAFQL